MCIIPGPIESVSNTKLFVLPNKNKTRQMTFYMNSVGTPERNMMILPVPNIGSIELHKIRYKNIFGHLKRSVFNTKADTHLTRSHMLCASIENDTLEVFDHGSYLVSIAPKIADLFRLDSSIFRVPVDIYPFFSLHYNEEFGYLCCVLKEGKRKYEPLCYSHALHSSGKLFVPTLHYHNHDGRIDTENADWDHEIYSLGTDEVANLQYGSHVENKILWNRFPESFQYNALCPIRCARLEGTQNNKDIAFVIAS